MTTNPLTELIEDTVRTLAAKLSDTVLVDTLEKVETLAGDDIPASMVDLCRSLLIQAVEQRIDGVADVVNAWWESMPWDQGLDQEDYAEAVVRFARERLDG